MLSTLQISERPDEETLIGLHRQALTLLQSSGDIRVEFADSGYLDLGTLQLLLALQKSLAARCNVLQLNGVGERLKNWLRIGGAQDIFLISGEHTNNA